MTGVDEDSFEKQMRPANEEREKQDRVLPSKRYVTSQVDQLEEWLKEADGWATTVHRPHELHVGFRKRSRC